MNRFVKNTVQYLILAILAPAVHTTAFPHNNGDLLSVVIHPDIECGIVGTLDANSPDDPADNVFLFELDNAFDQATSVLLTFRVKSLSKETELAFSLNDEQALNGYSITKSNTWVQFHEEIDASALKHGRNVLRFTTANSLNGAFEVRDIAMVYGNAGDGQNSGMTNPHVENLQFAQGQRTYTAVSAFRNSSLALGSALLDIPAGAVADEIHLSITGLGEADVVAMNPRMINVTSGAEGYRCLPHGMTFTSDLELTLHYDSSSIPVGYTARDLRIFFFDESIKEWVALPEGSIDSSNQTITALTDHFTDFVAGVIKVPETPQTESYTETKLSSIPHASAAENIQLMQPPTANAMGAARTFLPIDIPQGRNGMEPELSLNYDSDAGNGWCGLGWNLQVPAISVETRWGVPRFSSTMETETYLVDGQQLAPVAHRGPAESRTANRTFTRRVEGSFERITRHGSSPKNYWWEMTDKEGKTRYYGGRPGQGVDAAAVLTDASGNIAYWCLVEERDPNDNTITYRYDIVQDVGITGSVTAGFEIYPDEITYTGHGGEEGLYKVRFTRRNESGGSRRADVSISARWGFKQVTADLLSAIHIEFDGEPVRSYELEYTTGAFSKTLLASVAVFDENGEEFYRHTLEYYDDVRQNGAYVPFGDNVPWETPPDDVRGNILAANALFPNETSMLGGSSTSDWSAGSALTIGPLGNLAAKTNTAGGNYTFGRANGEGLIAFVDINGDGLPDKVFRKNDKLYYRPNLSSSNNNFAFGAQREIPGVNQFSVSQTNSHAIGAEAHPGIGFVGYTNTRVTTTVSTYFSDFNGDGLVDIAFEGKVFFNHIGANGDPVFTLNSTDTPSPIEVSGQLDDDLFTVDPQELEDRIDQNPLHDVVRMWEAPIGGTISINAPVQLIENTSPAAQVYDKKDGVRVAVQVNGTERWSAVIEPDDFSVIIPNGLSGISVNRGDRVYFRVQSRFDGAYDQVKWDPVITYQGQPADEIDANCKTNYRYTASEDFTLSSCQVVGAPINGEVRIDGRFEKPVTSDDVRVQVSAFDGANLRVIYDSTYVWDSVVVHDISVVDVAVDTSDEIMFQVKSSTNVEWSAINWMPLMTYTKADDGSPVNAPDGTPMIRYCPAPEYLMFNDMLDITRPWIASADGTLDVSQALNFSGLPDGRITLSVKGVKRFLGSVSININNGSPAAVSPISVDVVSGDTLYFEYHTSDRDLALEVSSARVSLSLNGGNATTEPAGLYTYRDGEDIIFGPMYRFWGQFAYNGNRDRANQPINESELMIDQDAIDNAGEVEDIDDPDNIGDVYDASDEPFIVMISDMKNRYWIGADDLTFIRTDTVSSSRLGEDDILPPSFNSDGTTVNAPFIETKSYINSVAGGVSGGPVGAGGSIAFNTTENQLDVLDLNGDRYPDIVTRDMIQYTTTRGGLEEQAVVNSLESHTAHSFAWGLSASVGFVYSSATNSGNTRSARSTGSHRASVSSASSAKSAKSSQSTRSSRAKSSASKSNKKAGDASRASKVSVGIDGGFTQDRDSTEQSWIDINGDGLVDMVYIDGTVALNYGYSFGPREPWGFESIHEGFSRDYGGGLGVNLFSGSIVAGVSINRTDNESDIGFQDVNGDGLPDLVVSIMPLRVRINTGNGFTSPVEWSGAEYLDKGSSTGESVNGAFTVCIPIVVIGIRICVNPSASTGRGVSRVTQQLDDVDGDGFVDYLTSDNDGELSSRSSTIGRTNLLKTIHRPLGATVELDYRPSGNTYDLPYSIWALSGVTVNDGLPGDGVDIRKTSFEYANGHFDRHEREFFGFGTIRIHELDTENSDSIYRTTVLTYNNRDFYTKGLPTSELIVDGGGNPYYESTNEYTLLDITTGDPLPPSAAQSDLGSIFPALTRSMNLYYEGEVSAEVTTSMSYEYDNLGNVTRYVDNGDGTDADRYEALVSYHDDDANYIKAMPRSVEIVSTGNTLRYREQDIDSKGNITEIREYLSPGESATTSFTFDDFGNIIEVTRPENEQGQRLAYQYTIDDVVNTYTLSTSDSYGYTSSEEYDYKYGQVVKSTDINGQEILFEIDSKGRISKITGPYEIAEGAPYALAFEYFPNAETPYAITRRHDIYGQRDVVTVEFLDGLARMIQSKKAGYVHTGNGQGKEVVIVSGTDQFDPFGRKAASYYPLEEAPGSITTYNTSLDQVPPTRMAYDVLDRVIEVTLPDGSVTAFEFAIEPDNIGIPRIAESRIDALGNLTVKYRDCRERIRAEMDLGPNGEIWTNFEYNAISEMVKVIDNGDNEIQYEYDQLGRKTSIVHPDGGTSEFVFDKIGNMTEKLTDKIISDAPNGGAVYYTYDYERLTQIDYPKNFQNKVQLHYGEPGADFNRAGRIWLREDASGGEELFFGPLGETVKSIRTMLINSAVTPTFVTEYQYDTWGRIREMRYPDGEIVEYTYNPAGNLHSIKGIKEGIEYEYLKARGYDKFEEIVFARFGNDAYSEYAFDPERRWMNRMRTATADGTVVQDNNVDYDAIGNVLSIANTVNTAPDQLGGPSEHRYTYDKLYRLTNAEGTWSGNDATSTYTLVMEYDDLHNITLKDQVLMLNGEKDKSRSYRYDYVYDGDKPHAPSEVSGRVFTYDEAGNLLSTRGETAFTFTQLIWDEENRLRGVSNNGYISHYTYDGSGNRAIKSHGGQQGVFVDGAPAGAINHQDQYTVYVNPYFSYENDRFVKHYFAGENKILSKIGNGKFHVNILSQQGVTAGDLNYSRRMQLLTDAQDNYYKQLGVPPGPPTLQGYYPQPEVTGNPLPSGGGSGYSNPPANWPQSPGPPDPNGPPGPPVWYDNPQSRDDIRAGYGFDPTGTNVFKEVDVFYYHLDHLGSAHFLTDFQGKVRQYTEYLPFGEVFIDNHTSSDSYRYKFNGKELDEETGYYYYGARYFDPRLSMWNSVDPLADLMPAWSPYAYTMHNPLRFTEPDGKWPGQLFASPNDAAKDFAMEFNPQSIETNLEIGSRIYMLTGDGKKYYAYSQPTFSTEEDGVTPSDAPTGFQVVGDIHTHGAYSPKYKSDVFSGQDGDLGGIAADRIDYDYDNYVGYVATPKGRLLKYKPKTGKISTVSKSIPFDPNHPKIRSAQKLSTKSAKPARTSKKKPKANHALHLGGSGKSARN